MECNKSYDIPVEINPSQMIQHPEQHNNAYKWYKPLPDLHKIKSPLSFKKNIVLLLTGQFYPININHISTLETTIHQINEQNEYNVIGGFIVPLHPQTLEQEFGYNNILNNEIRLQLCQKAIEDSEWISLLPFVSMEQNNIGISEAKKYLEQYINQNLEQNEKCNIEIGLVQSDNQLDYIEEILYQQSSNLIIIAQNQSNEIYIDISTWLNSEKIIRFKQNIIIVRNNQIDISDNHIRYLLSSEELIMQYQNELENFLTKKVYQFILQEKIIFPEKKIKSFLEELLGLYIPVEIPFNQLIQEEIPQKLGQGLQGVVLSMIWKKNENEEIPVAVKMTNIKKDKTRKIKTFSRDLRGLLLCNHPNIVKCYGAGIQDDNIFVVMEKGLPINISHFIQEQRYKQGNEQQIPIKWYKYLAEVADGLHHMSQQGILHRDLQINNIVLFKRIQNEKEQFKNELEFNIKICGFGVSALESDKHLVVRGSTRHQSPEAIEDKSNYVTASDVYSFGNLLYEILNGKLIFNQFSVEDSKKKILNGERPTFTEQFDHRIQHIIQSCWLNDPKLRPTFHKVAQDLMKIYSDKI